jgi:glycosyltransferase involved in cell wall biosynthesis
MRIIYCNKYNFAFSGTESYLFEVMDLMRTRGHATALFSMADPRGEPTPYDQQFVPLINLKSDGQSALQKVKMAGHVIYSLDAKRRIRRMIADFKPDVAHVRNIYHHLSPSILWELKAQKIPVIYHVNDFKMLCPSYNLVAHGQACERCKGGKFWHVVTEGCYAGSRSSALVLAAEAYAHRWLKTYQRCVDLFLAPSQFVKDKLVESGFDEHKINVLPHFQKLPERSIPILKPDAPILYFGRLSPEKGVGDLLQAMQQLPAIQLQIAGDGPQREELERLSQNLNLRNVEFAGHRKGTGLDQLIAAARFTIFPSHAYETMGKSILESYAWKRPVIASDLGSRRELVKDGLTGLLFPVGNVQKLAEAISLLARHPELAAKMGNEGCRLVREHHRPEKHYSELLALYERLGKSAPKTPSAKTPPVKSKLKIAFIGGRGVVSKYSGIESYYEEVGRQLAGMGNEVTVYCRSYFTPAIGEHNGMRIVRLPTIRSKHLETIVHTLLSTLHATFGKHDVIHFHALGPALFSFLPRFFGKKTVVTVQGLDWQRKKWGRIAASVLRLGEQASVKLPNATMVVSQTLQQHFQSRYDTQTAYIPNGTSLRKRRVASQLVKWGIEPENYVLFLGRFSPEKNCHLLIEAFERTRSSAKLVLAGGSSYSDAYAAELRRHASNQIRLLDWVSGDDLEELLTNAMLFVLPSDLEGLSLALLDAMGAGVCVLTSDVPENREVVQDAGFTFKRGDVQDLERMLRLLIKNPKLRQAAAMSARQRVRERYLWRGIAVQINQTYRQLVNPQARASTISPTKVSSSRDVRAA